MHGSVLDKPWYNSYNDTIYDSLCDCNNIDGRFRRFSDRLVVPPSLVQGDTLTKKLLAP